MFKKKESDTNITELTNEVPVINSKSNTILKGSTLKGDISVSYDLELSGEVTGNVTSKENSSVTIKGICKGNIDATGGSVFIEGELQGGSIMAGADVKITGHFDGGEVNAKGKSYINGNFKGKISAKEIELGPKAVVAGEIFYQDSFTVARGAQLEATVVGNKKTDTVHLAPASFVTEAMMPETEEELPSSGITDLAA